MFYVKNFYDFINESAVNYSFNYNIKNRTNKNGENVFYFYIEEYKEFKIIIKKEKIKNVNSINIYFENIEFKKETNEYVIHDIFNIIKRLIIQENFLIKNDLILNINFNNYLYKNEFKENLINFIKFYKFKFFEINNENYIIYNKLFKKESIKDIYKF